MTGPTRRQLQVLRFVEHFIREHGYAPTNREIRDAFGLTSTNAVNDHLVALETKGYISRDAFKQRSIVIVKTASGAEPAAKNAAEHVGYVRGQRARRATVTAWLRSLGQERLANKIDRDEDVHWERKHREKVE